MDITEEWLQEQSTCSEGIDWFISQEEKEGENIVRKLMAEREYQWANWLIVRLMTDKQKVQYAVRAADAAYAAASAASTAAYVAYATSAADASSAAAYACYAAASAADAAASAASAAAYASYAAASAADADYAADAVRAAENSMYIKILNHGLELMEGKV